MTSSAARQKRSVTISGHRTSVSLEPSFWEALERLARADGKSIAEIVRSVDASRAGEGLASALRLFVLERLKAAQPPRY